MYLDITGQSHIGFQRGNQSSITFQTFNAALNQNNPWKFYEANDDEINRAVELAASAFISLTKISKEDKALFLDSIADEILAIGDRLIEVYCLESSLPRGRAENERGRTVFQLRSFANQIREGSWVQATIDTAITDRVPPKPDLRKMMVGIGPIVVFGSSNFPFAYSTAGGDTASAFAAGCPVIVKSHPMHSGTGELVANAVIKAAQKTGMPEGIFSNLNSKGIEVGQKLALHPDVKGIGFTGSLKGGKALYDLAATRPEPIPVFAEMGSINPIILLPEALRSKSEFWAGQYAISITLGSGQFCTNPGLILSIKGNELNEFKNFLVKKIKEIPPACMLHPNIFANYTKGVNAMEENGTERLTEVKNCQPNFGENTIMTIEGEVFLANPDLHKEVFGPYSLIVACDDKAQLELIVKKLDGQLTATIISSEKEINDYSSLIDALRTKVGRIIYNGVPTGVEVCPAMNHGGPYPASSDSRFTAVGVHSIKRWLRPICFQSWPHELLPEELKNVNNQNILREVNGLITRDSIIF